MGGRRVAREFRRRRKRLASRIATWRAASGSTKMTTNRYAVPQKFAAGALVQRRQYDQMYGESIEDPEGFWGRIGRRIDWIEDFSRVKDSSYAEADFHIRWYHGGKLNVAGNCLDRHLKTRGDKT